MARQYHSEVAQEIRQAVETLQRHGLSELNRNRVLREIGAHLLHEGAAEDALAVAGLFNCTGCEEKAVGLVTSRMAMTA